MNPLRCHWALTNLQRVADLMKTCTKRTQSSIITTSLPVRVYTTQVAHLHLQQNYLWCRWLALQLHGRSPNITVITRCHRRESDQTIPLQKTAAWALHTQDLESAQSRWLCTRPPMTPKSQMIFQQINPGPQSPTHKWESLRFTIAKTNIFPLRNDIYSSRD